MRMAGIDRFAVLNNIACPRFRAAEALFQPALMGYEYAGLHETL